MRRALRPPHYRRGLVFEVPGGLIDGKGFNALPSENPAHQTRTATLAEVLREWQMHHLVGSVLRHAHSEYSAIRPYAVIDWGFRAGADNDSHAGAILRQAHVRYDRGVHARAAHNFNNYHAARVEGILRRYGITTSGAYREADFLMFRDLAWINVQGDRAARRIVDFGWYRVMDEAYDPRDLANFGQEDPILHHHDPRAAIDQRMRIPVGHHHGGGGNGEPDQSTIDAHAIARQWASGQIDRAGIRRYMAERTEFIERHLARAPHPSESRSVRDRRSPPRSELSRLRKERLRDRGSLRRR